MPLQVFECPEHGEFQTTLKFSEEVPKWKKCRRVLEHHGEECDDERSNNPLLLLECKFYECGLRSKHVIKPIACAIVEGGTGGGKDMHLVR